MQLQHVGADDAGDRRQQVVVGVDRQRDDLGAVARLGGEFVGVVEADEARALGEEHQPDHVGAGVERRLERRRGGQTADFDRRNHAPVSDKTPAESKIPAPLRWAGLSRSAGRPTRSLTLAVIASIRSASALTLSVSSVFWRQQRLDALGQRGVLAEHVDQQRRLLLASAAGAPR